MGGNGAKVSRKRVTPISGEDATDIRQPHLGRGWARRADRLLSNRLRTDEFEQPVGA